MQRQSAYSIFQQRVADKPMDAPWHQPIPTLNQRPTQPPLNRDQQKAAFEQRKQMYSTEAPPAPPPPQHLTPVKELKLSEEQSLKAMRDQMAERGLQTQVAKVEQRIEEKHTADTIKQFYCNHQFQQVKAQLGPLPVKYRICKGCGLVK